MLQPREVTKFCNGRVSHTFSGHTTSGNLVTAPMAEGKKRDAFVFFDNTDKLMAPGDAKGLMQRLGVVWEGSRS